MAEPPAEILLVEDSPDDVAFFRHTLERSGLVAQLHTLADGAAAMDFLFGGDAPGSRAQISRLRLIILDLKLPKVGGGEILRRLKTEGGTRGIPVVVLSSSQVDRDIVESYNLGVNSYIVKPLDFDAYTASIRMLCQYWLEFNRVP